jgi:hypothetical protein
MMEDSRLGRIELKLDKLSEAVVSLARMEERMITLFKRMDNYEQDHDELSDRVTDLEATANRRGVIFGLVDKITWIVVGVLIALGIEFLLR